MAKKGKTRKQKILSDLRRKSNSSKMDYEVTTSTKNAPVLSTNTPKLAEKPTQETPTIQSFKTVVAVKATNTPSRDNSISTVNYKYLKGDLLKTLVLTGSIAIIEIFIHLFVKTI